MTAGRDGVLGGLGALAAGLSFLRERRELWIWCALPALLTVALFAGALAVYAGYLHEPLSAWLAGRLDVGPPSAWYAWLWVGPLRLLAWAVRWLLLLAAAVAVYALFTVVGGVIAAPFLEALSARVERIRSGQIAVHSEPFARAALRAVAFEARRTGLFTALQLALLALALVPGLAPVVAVAGAVVAAGFLALDYTAHPFDRRGVPFAERRRWLLRHRGALFSFGFGALATFFVPGLNFLCLPWLVTSGTLLALELA
jgi:CysZ protein